MNLFKIIICCSLCMVFHFRANASILTDVKKCIVNNNKVTDLAILPFELVEFDESVKLSFDEAEIKILFFSGYKLSSILFKEFIRLHLHKYSDDDILLNIYGLNNLLTITLKNNTSTFESYNIEGLDNAYKGCLIATHLLTSQQMFNKKRASYKLSYSDGTFAVSGYNKETNFCYESLVKLHDNGHMVIDTQYLCSGSDFRFLKRFTNVSTKGQMLNLVELVKPNKKNLIIEQLKSFGFESVSSSQE